ncbi:hypothetical protein HYC85_004064 [Camellia sinensis]|uniref:Uncharacterized protein n=1 Tax=Camellia sinensis TaxID=4442 RepID=A0A7J7HW07_CAMSI|nr:hypothetical protein HYC85_004064 [Camellia sinensis]
MENFPLSQVLEYAHLLDLLYHLMVPKLEEPQKPSTTDVQKSTTKFNAKQHVDSVSYLSNIAGVEFYPTTGDITTIRFEEEEKRFYLPVITLNVHSEVIMRNLVAYEASTVSESLVFAGYTELLNGIMETVEDAKLLREKKIIINRLKSDDEVLQLFNSINKSIQLTHVPYVDKAIEDVNRFFYNSRRVQAYKWIKKYVYGFGPTCMVSRSLWKAAAPPRAQFVGWLVWRGGGGCSGFLQDLFRVYYSGGLENWVMVLLQLVHNLFDSVVDMEKTDASMIIFSLLSIAEGRVCFPLHPFLRVILRYRGNDLKKVLVSIDDAVL